MLNAKQGNFLESTLKGIHEVASAIWRNKFNIVVGMAAIYGVKKSGVISEEKPETCSAIPLVNQPKQMELPFSQAGILSSLHQGLTIPFNTTENDVICDFENVYQGWVSENAEQVSLTMSGNYSLLFYSQEGKYKDNRTSADLLFVKLPQPTGRITLNAIEEAGEEVTPTVSCRAFRG